ncbi:MAG: hypothetical protein FJ006_12035 [Chloroflexi bacterium]|nr:hypothetical protein [Chloroflexota bacterium]
MNSIGGIIAILTVFFFGFIGGCAAERDKEFRIKYTVVPVEQTVMSVEESEIQQAEHENKMLRLRLNREYYEAVLHTYTNRSM